MTFEEYLRKENLSEQTISVYLWTVNYYNQNYDLISKENLLAYKGYLIEYFKPKTVNLRIQAINKYLDYLDLKHLRLSSKSQATTSSGGLKSPIRATACSPLKGDVASLLLASL